MRFIWGLSSHLRIFHSHGDVTITFEGLQILSWNFARHSWLLSIEGSLACQTYSDTGHPFIMVISSRTCDTHIFCRALSSGAVTTCFYDRLRSVTAWIWSPTFQLRGQRSKPLRHRRGQKHIRSFRSLTFRVVINIGTVFLLCSIWVGSFRGLPERPEELQLSVYHNIRNERWIF